MTSFEQDRRIRDLQGRVLSLEAMMRDLIEGLKVMPGIPFGENFRKIGNDLEEEWGK